MDVGLGDQALGPETTDVGLGTEGGHVTSSAVGTRGGDCSPWATYRDLSTLSIPRWSCSFTWRVSRAFTSDDWWDSWRDWERHGFLERGEPTYLSSHSSGGASLDQESAHDSELCLVEAHVLVHLVHL